MLQTDKNCSENATFEINYEQSVPGTFILTWIVLSNVIAIIMLSWSIRKKESIAKVLVLALSCLDLAIGVFPAPMQVLGYWISYCEFGGAWMCVLKGFMYNFLSMASNFIIILMSIERFFAIKRPFTYERHFTLKRSRVSIVIVVVYALLVASLPLMGVNRFGYGRWCDFQWDDFSASGRFYAILFITQGFVGLLVILMCNFGTIHELQSSYRKVRPGRIKNDQRQENKEKLRFVCLICSISVIYIVCTMPYLVRILFNQFGIFPSIDADYVAMRMNVGNSMANAHLYFFSQLYIYLSRRCRRKKGVANMSVNDSQMFKSSSSVFMV